jgi:hypothetical protein
VNNNYICIMPVPALLALGLQLAPQIIGGIKEKKRLEKDFEREKKALQGLKAQEKQLLEKRQYGVGDAWNQYLSASKQDKAADLQRQIASEQEATAIGALKSGGAKALLGGLGASQRQAAQQRMGIEADSQARQQAALQQYAGVQQRAADLNVGLAAEDLERTQGLKDESKLRKELLRGEKRAASDERLMNILGGVNSVAGLAFGTAKDGMAVKNLFSPSSSKAVKPDDLFAGISESISEEKAKPRYTSVYGTRAGSYKTTVQDRMGSGAATQDDLNSALTGTEEEDTSAADVSRASRNNALENVLSGSYQLGDLTRNNRYGGKYASGGVQKTPGEFSHAKNPIDIMKDGAKIGEMTGGEYIFNPRQASTLQSLASKGGSPLHKYVRNLLKEFDKR